VQQLYNVGQSWQNCARVHVPLPGSRGKAFDFELDWLLLCRAHAICISDLGGWLDVWRQSVGYIVMNDTVSGKVTELLRMEGAHVVGAYHGLVTKKLVTTAHRCKLLVTRISVFDDSGGHCRIKIFKIFCRRERCVIQKRSYMLLFYNLSVLMHGCIWVVFKRSCFFLFSWFQFFILFYFLSLFFLFSFPLSLCHSFFLCSVVFSFFL